MTGHTITPVPLSITRDGDQLRVHGSTFDIILLQVIVSAWLQPQIQQSIETGGMPPMLPQPRAAIEMGGAS